jgi:hypothetical protein
VDPSGFQADPYDTFDLCAENQWQPGCGWNLDCVLGAVCSHVDTVPLEDNGGFTFGREENTNTGGGIAYRGPSVVLDPQLTWFENLGAELQLPPIPSADYDNLLGQLQVLSWGLATPISSWIHGGPVVDYGSVHYQRGALWMGVVYTVLTAGTGSVQSGTVVGAGAARTGLPILHRFPTPNQQVINEIRMLPSNARLTSAQTSELTANLDRVLFVQLPRLVASGDHAAIGRTLNVLRGVERTTADGRLARFRPEFVNQIPGAQAKISQALADLGL